MSARCPAWCVDHDRPDPLDLPVLHYGARLSDQGDDPYVFQEGTDRPMIALFGEPMTLPEAERLSLLLAACLRTARQAAA